MWLKLYSEVNSIVYLRMVDKQLVEEKSNEILPMMTDEYRDERLSMRVFLRQVGNAKRATHQFFGRQPSSGESKR